MSNKLVECPNCIGTGEEIHKGRYVKKCHTCDGDGMVHKDISDAYLSTLRYYDDEDIY